MNQTSETPDRQSKRDFLKIILSGGVVAFFGAILYPLFEYLIPPKQAEVEVSSVKAGKLSEIANDSGQIIKFGTKPVILIRTAEGELRAFSATCTHLDCTVQYRKDFGTIWCACHNGKYDLHGKNISGPPPRPLDEMRVVVQGDDILISKKV
ncbi:MAG: plastoquinol--plastocyanin reductase [Ignavibacteriae bacterium]|nr:MAG: plastoquinol--plastocyanin reductase [Ignavibacteriota bacterium]